jgi:YD repeat-containing protein
MRWVMAVVGGIIAVTAISLFATRSLSVIVAFSEHLTPHTAGYGDTGQSGAYTYDSSGNITAIGADTYVYDAENRLTTSVTRGVTESYTYDAFGNRKTATGATNCLGQSTCAQSVTVSNTTNRLLTINASRFVSLRRRSMAAAVPFMRPALIPTYSEVA